MEPVSLWAAVEFTACNGSTEALLTAAARGRAASLRGNGPAGRALAGGAPRGSTRALPRWPQAPGAAAHPPEAWGCISVCAPCCAGPGFGQG